MRFVSPNGTVYNVTATDEGQLSVDEESILIPPGGEDLATLEDVKTFLNLEESGDDDMLQRLIAAASIAIQSWASRRFAVQEYSRKLNGQGGHIAVFPDSPVVSVSSVSIDGMTIPLSADYKQSGYRFDDTALFLTGYIFTRGFQNIAITYIAGYYPVPADITQACIDLVAQKYRERDRIGQVSKSISGEVITFKATDIRDDIKTVLMQYRKVMPT